MDNDKWLIWQLIDSAFPSGGLAHSGGVESAWQAGLVRGADGLTDYVRASLLQLARGSVPLVGAAWREPEALEQLDQLAEASLTNHVTNRASRLQGQAFLSAAQSIYGQVEAVAAIRGQVRCQRLAGHLAPVFGAVTRGLGLGLDDAGEMFMYTSMRGVVSAAVRLGIVGPLEGQRIQHLLSDDARAVAARFVNSPVEELAGASPIVDVAGGMADRLYSRLFQS